ncbi:histidine--tRNA ligase [Candidatus Halobeggiatoa sp. HSG11]|nr:histidine--tRNA ligase [Candidatus Halobeggiatoa sp. HSG11]
MAKKLISSVRGMNDILPEQTPIWQHVEAIIKKVLDSYGYQEIRLPILEATELFSRSIGEVTDIVEKEMFSFTDRNGDNLSLRPEGTAGCVRAGIQRGLFHNQIQRLWYIGQMFRHERPQQGRYRQFHQIGAEVYGLDGPDIDAEIILMTARFWQQLGLDSLELQINSLGSTEARIAYRQKLIDYFSDYQEQLDDDSQRRLRTNPLRILDSKNPQMLPLIKTAPQLLDCLDTESQEHFAQLRELLDETGVKYQVNPCLVRGLDYYNRTVFEWITNDLGTQGTICAGGRYDSLVEQIGGKTIQAVGFALGLERLVLMLLQSELPKPNNAPDAYFIIAGNEQVTKQGLHLAELLRDALPNLRLLVNCGKSSFKSQFKRADKSGASLALILAEDELINQKITLKYLREKRPQVILEQSELINYLKNLD